MLDENHSLQAPKARISVGPATLVLQSLLTAAEIPLKIASLELVPDAL